MNRILLWVVLIAIVVVGANFLFMHQPSVPPTAQKSGCLAQGEVASNETSTTGDYVVVRNSQTNAEVSRFALPTSTILVNNFQQCSVGVIEANNYSVAQIRPGVITGYSLSIGGSIDQWQYSYDGNDQKNFTILSNVSPATGPAFLELDPSGQYISFIAPAQDDTEIQIYDLNTGAQLFSSNLSRVLAKSGSTVGLELWKGNASYSSWNLSNGVEVFNVAAEDGHGGAHNIIIDTKDWSASSRG
jgi:hypothetical protein